HYRVLYQIFLQALGECLLEGIRKIVSIASSEEFQKHIPGRGYFHRIATAFNMPTGKFHSPSRHQFEGGHAFPGCCPEVGEQGYGRSRIRNGSQCSHNFARSRVQFQDSCCNDAQGAFSANEKLLQVISGIVLAKPAQTVPDSSICQHDFETEYE